MKIERINGLRGELNIPGDKSISHRSIMFGSIAEGTTEIIGFLNSADCISTMNCFKQMGISIVKNDNALLIHGKGLRGLRAPSNFLDVGNSGTTTRLISGILVGQDFHSVLSGDVSLNSRPMNRIIRPLSKMGADITSLHNNGCAPLSINGTPHLHGIHHISERASAQVKSAVLLAGLYADDATKVTEPSLSRNHTELMLRSFGADLETYFDENGAATASIKPADTLYGQKISVPGDISSAAYFIAAGLLVPNSEILLKNVGINPTRAGILSIAKQMGANITYLNQKVCSGEPVSDLLVKSSSLNGTIVEGSIIPTLIDEIPIIAVMAALAKGTTIIRNAEELKVKETNRIDATVNGLKAMGVDIVATDDGMIIYGGTPLHSASIDSNHDHRIAMAFSIAGLIADGTTTIQDSACVSISYPTFYSELQKLSIT